MEYWSIGLDAAGIRLKAHGARKEIFCLLPYALCLAPDTASNIHYSSTPVLQHSFIGLLL
jgi:hypothetical protein